MQIFVVSLHEYLILRALLIMIDGPGYILKRTVPECFVVQYQEEASHANPMCQLVVTLQLASNVPIHGLPISHNCLYHILEKDSASKLVGCQD